jgi:hypothetical protein
MKAVVLFALLLLVPTIIEVPQGDGDPVMLEWPFRARRVG